MEVDDDNIVPTDSSRQVCKTFVAVNEDFYSRMFRSLSMERKRTFCSLLQNTDIDLNVLNEHGESLLHASLKCSDEYFLNEILKRGVSLEQKMYRTILHDAVTLNKPSFVEPLLKYEVSMNNVDESGRTPLGIAIEKSNIEIVSMLLYYNCDCDTYPNGHTSPFMQSMLCGSAREIQLLLLEYESEIYYTHLVTAIHHCWYLIPHILNYDVDVNQVSNNRNIIYYILLYPIQSNIFRMIWEKFDYEIWNSTMEESILLTILHCVTLPNNLWDEYLRIIIESSKLQTILNCYTPLLISSLVMGYIDRGFVESDFFDLICILLVNGCSVYDINLHMVYTVLGGSSSILKLLLHTDIVNVGAAVTDYSFILVRYRFDTPINELLRRFFFKMKIMNVTPSFRDILKYFTVPPKVKNYLKNHQLVHCPSITWNHDVPTLLELSRNKSRDFICQKFKVKTSSRYCSIVKHYALPEIVKQILMFERPLYFNA